MATIFRSTDASAPTLSGTVGSLIALLDACLVNGYGAKSAAGWTKQFSDTNKAVYRMSTAGTAAGYGYRIDDTGAAPSTTSGAREAIIHGSVAFTDVDTASTTFPANMASLSTTAIRKSSTLDATTRAWTVVADGRTAYVFTQPGDVAGRYVGVAFGEIYSFDTSIIRCYNIARPPDSTSSQTGLETATNSPAAASGHVYWHIVNAVSNGCSQFGYVTAGGATYNAPNPPDSKIYLFRKFVGGTAASQGILGYHRGLYELLNAATGMSDGDTFSGTGDFSGKTFEVIKPAGGSATKAYAIETTSWDTN